LSQHFECLVKLRAKFDGLLYGLIGLSGPVASHVLRILPTGAAVPGKLPGKLTLRWRKTREWKTRDGRKV